MFRTTGALVAAALGASIVLIPTPASADSDWRCYGTQVRRCATVYWDQAADTFRARAKITDAAGGGSFQVKVTNVKLQRAVSGDYVTVRTAADTDGWHGTEDRASTTSVDPCNPRHTYSVVATFSWRGADSGERTWRPDAGWLLSCN
jgi:hypothetical protein